SARESILPEMPDVDRHVLLLRSELEELAAPRADAVIDIVRTGLEQCAARVDVVLLTGGLATMPLVSQRLSADLALDVHVPEDPRLVVTRGADRLLSLRQATGGKKAGRPWRRWIHHASDLTQRAAHFSQRTIDLSKAVTERDGRALTIAAPVQVSSSVEGGPRGPMPVSAVPPKSEAVDSSPEAIENEANENEEIG